MINFYATSFWKNPEVHQSNIELSVSSEKIFHIPLLVLRGSVFVVWAMSWGSLLKKDIENGSADYKQ